MTNDKDAKKIQEAARKGIKYSLATGIAPQAADILKGASPVPKMIQLKTEIKQFIRSNVQDSSGVLIQILERRVNQGDQLIDRCSETPLMALKEIIQKILSADHSFYEFVRQVDQQYGMSYGERPHFQKPGQQAHPDDEYTHESVKSILGELVKLIHQET